ncbi:Mediator of RNA polymerase II transcription subunit 10 [Mortierella hygrophila]|uniref:Mediator of RNA polymerase II transcription subunit 10 n=1 Tax=Mortierella hygrophila TaxID=979708 RepID=A0A9P6EWV3_9FUNG|nr:Mediator of RNA polymerase II transcription subunit 10 [Mortierella hygrophila]
MASVYNDSQSSIQNNMVPTPSQTSPSTIPSAQGAGGLVGATSVALGTTTTQEPLSSSTSTSAPSTAAAAGGGGGGSAQPDPTELAAAETERHREALEKKLQELIQSLLELSITVYDFQAESNSLVHQKIQELTKQLGEIEAFKDQLDVMVPWEVLSYIEDGKNPDLFSKTFVEAVAGENQFTNGKVTAMKASLSSLSFEAALAQNLGDAFPDDMADYDQILQEVSSKSGQSATLQ